MNAIYEAKRDAYTEQFEAWLVIFQEGRLGTQRCAAKRKNPSFSAERPLRDRASSRFRTVARAKNTRTVASEPHASGEITQIYVSEPSQG